MDTLQANEYILKEKQKESISFIKKVIDENRELPIAVSFSGGKDSTVVLSLTRQIKSDVDMIFLDTTIELPETLAFTYKLAKLWNLNLISVKSSHSFLNLCRLIGPPSRFMKWCCKTQKFSPMSELIHERYSNGVIMIRGVRAAESNKRKGYKRIGKLKWTPKEILANPILYWSALDVWLYIFWKKIPYNKAYEYGFTRLGCWPCPCKSLKDFEILKGFYPELAKRFYSFLKEYAKKQNLSNNWIKSGRWRFRKSRVDRTLVRSSKLCGSEEDHEIIFSLDDPERVQNVLEFFKIFGSAQKKGSISMITNKIIETTFIGNNIHLKIKDERIEGAVIGYIERALNCIGCGACQYICNNGAIKQVNGKRIIDQQKCKECLKCLTFTCIALKYGSRRFSLQPNRYNKAQRQRYQMQVAQLS